VNTLKCRAAERPEFETGFGRDSNDVGCFCVSVAEDRNKASLRDFCVLKEAGVMDAVPISVKDCCLLDVAQTFKIPVVLVLFIDTFQL
jgi:hypothetical protein